MAGDDGYSHMHRRACALAYTSHSSKQASISLPIKRQNLRTYSNLDAFVRPSSNDCDVKRLKSEERRRTLKLLIYGSRLFSEVNRGGFSSGTPVPSPPSLINGFSQGSKAKINVASTVKLNS